MDDDSATIGRSTPMRRAEMDDCTWPVEGLYELLHRLCEHAGLAPRGGEIAAPTIVAAALTESLALAGRQLGIEAHASPVPVDRLEDELWRAAPAVLRIDRGDRVELVGIVAGTSRGLTVVGRNGEPMDVEPAALRAFAFGDPPSGPASPAILPPARARLLELATSPAAAIGVARVWQLTPSPGGSLWRPGDAGRAVGLAALHLVRLLLLALSWWLLGRGALEGRLDLALLSGWMLVLATQVAVSGVVDWVQGHLLLDLNLRYRRKTMHGATRVAPRTPRALGSGQLLGRVFETEALDTLAVNAGISAITAAIDIGFAVALFLAIPGAGSLAGVFVGWLVLVVAGGGWLYGLQRSWTLERIAMSEEVVEGLLGRRTRLAQLGARRSHRVEDRTLERYLRASARVDQAETLFEAVSARGWLVAGLLALAMIAGAGAMPPGPTAAALGGVLLGFQALGRVAGSVHLAAALVIGWRQARVLVRASSAPEVVGVPELVEAERRGRTTAPFRGELVQTRGLSYRPEPDRDVVIDDISLSIAGGDRILLTGPSGGGKSTLARLLSGLELPSAGTVSLRGLDRRALGEHEWARRIAYVPPFCDNHVFSASFLYNLLPGVSAPGPAEIEEAEQVCTELGLGPLLARMPGHLQQTVGETGWRLSHGERCRLFLARALLQRAELVILDESFGALDASTLEASMDCVLRRSPALVLISHV